MPQFGRFQFGKRFKYGKYIVLTDDGLSIGPHVVYRIRQKQKEISPFLRMGYEEIQLSLPEKTRFRIRANNGEWVSSMTEEIGQEVHKVRIRSFDANGSPSPWVHGDRIEIQESGRDT